jgi:integrase
MGESERRGFGHIRRRGKVYYARWHENGVQKEEAIGKRRGHAERFLARKAMELERYRALGQRDVVPLRFEDLLDEYEAVFAGDKSPTTIARDAAILRAKALPWFKGKRLDEIRRDDVERFLLSRLSRNEIGPATRNRLLCMLSGLFRKAVELNHARENPCRGIRRLKEKVLDRPFLYSDDQDRLVAAVEAPMRWAVAFALDTGLRAGELLRLERRDIDFSRRAVTVRVSKSGKPRTVGFGARGLEALQKALEGRMSAQQVPDLLFLSVAAVNRRGEPCFTGKAQKAWERGRKRAGHPEMRFHDLRHVFASTAMRAGYSVAELQYALGHSGPTMVRRDARHAPANSPELARARLDRFLKVQRQAASLGGL